MKHALPESVRRIQWPSIAKDSQLLAERCAEGLRLLAMRERLALQFERMGQAA